MVACMASYRVLCVCATILQLSVCLSVACERDEQFANFAAFSYLFRLFVRCRTGGPPDQALDKAERYVMLSFALVRRPAS